MLRKYPVHRIEYVDIQPYTDRIRFNKRIESEDIRYPHFSGDNLTDCTRPFLFSRNGLGTRLSISYVVLFSTTQSSQLLIQHFFNDARSHAHVDNTTCTF